PATACLRYPTIYPIATQGFFNGNTCANIGRKRCRQERRANPDHNAFKDEPGGNLQWSNIQAHQAAKIAGKQVATRHTQNQTNTCTYSAIDHHQRQVMANYLSPRSTNRLHDSNVLNLF